MLKFQIPLPVKFICGLIYKEENIYIKTKDTLQKKFGIIDFESEKIDFVFTDYYNSETGTPLYRRFISFKKLPAANRFIKIKLFCVKLEKKLSTRGRRKINIDPGYLNEAKLILMTTKDFYHRIYLDKGVYAEVTLHYRDGKFQDFPTTFPDYRSQNYKDIFLQIRRIYRQQLHKKISFKK